MKRMSLLILAGVILLGGFAGATYLYNQHQAEQRSALAKKHAKTLIRDYSPRTGSPDAKVTIVEFFDPACETCKAFHPLVKGLLAQYPGKVNLVIRYAAFHRGSDYAVKVLEAARLQGKYWETLEATLEAQSAWASHGNPQPERLWMRLGRTGLDFTQAKQDMDSAEIARRLAQDTADVKAMRVNKTPTFFVNGKPLPRFGYAQLQQLVKSEVEANY